MFEFRHAAVHAAAIAGLILLFGANVYSGSIDVAAHFVLADFLTKYDLSALADNPSLGLMAYYPRGSHWLAAAIGFITGSAFSAMWLICIAAVYLAYYAISRLALAAGGYVCLIVFLATALAMRISSAVTGYEIFANFFYSQLVGTTVYFLLLLSLAKISEPTSIAAAFAVLLAATVLMTIHALPALNLVGTYGLFLALRAVLNALDSRKMQLKQWIKPVAFGSCCLVLLSLHPSLEAMKKLSSNDGSLNFGLNPPLMFGVALLVAALALLRLARARIDVRSTVDIFLVAALVTSAVLVAAQLTLFWLRGDGSLYAIKKHFFFLVPLTLLNAARLISLATPDIWRPKHEFAAAAISGLAMTFAIYGLAQPMSMRAVLKPLNFAQRAVDGAFGEFKPNETVVIASNVDRVTQFMIDIAVFKLTFDNEALRVIDGSFDVAQKSFVMIENSKKLRERCAQPQAQNADYAIVPTSCLLQLPLNEEISFTQGQGSGLHLRSGWWPPEDWGVWSSGRSGVLQFMLPDTIKGNDLMLTFDLSSFPPRTESAPVISIVVDGEAFKFEFHGTQSVDVKVPKVLTEDGRLVIELINERPTTPKAAGFNEDGRLLGVGLRSMKARRLSS